jgi:uncharacterized SAM-binding protein YcdF (DUF218 family)
MAGMRIDDDGMTHSTPAMHASRRAFRILGMAVLFGCGAILLAVTAGFAWFVWQVPAEEVALPRSADGIVALTGGASRISDAIEILAAGYGQRLLISGANPATNSHEISRLNPEFEKWVRCCVDFDRSVNTWGNAVEIKRWARQRGFNSLIIVTSNYHMPRALAEIAHQLPEITLLPFPVVSARLREPWWASSATARLMFSEYVKLLFARLRMAINPDAQASELVEQLRFGRFIRNASRGSSPGSAPCSSSGPSLSTSCSI